MTEQVTVKFYLEYAGCKMAGPWDSAVEAERARFARDEYVVAEFERVEQHLPGDMHGYCPACGTIGCRGVERVDPDGIDPYLCDDCVDGGHADCSDVECECEHGRRRVALPFDVDDPSDPYFDAAPLSDLGDER